MALYLGWPGRWLVLPDPAPGVGASLIRPHGEHLLLDGGRVIDFAGPGLRSYTMRWQRLTDDEYAVLEQVHSGAAGPGPFLLLPTDVRWNYLSPWQGASGGIGIYPDGFFVSDAHADASLFSVSAPVLRGPRAIAWGLVAGGPAGRLRLYTPSRGLAAWPALPQPWTFSIAGRADTEAGIGVRVRMVLRFSDADGTERPSTVSEPVTVTPGGWTPLAVSGIAPPGAAWVDPEVHVDDASITADTVLYLDTPAMQVGPARGWLPGRAVPVVSLVELSDLYAWHDLHDCEATWREVN